MICPQCFGAKHLVPCQMCGGFGIISCCDGLCGDEETPFVAKKLPQSEYYHAPNDDKLNDAGA